MYEPLELPPSTNEWLTELRDIIDAANTAHSTANLSAATMREERIRIDRELQLAVTDLENRLIPSMYAQNPDVRMYLTIVRDKIRERLSSQGQSLQIENEAITPLSQMIAKLPDSAAQKLMEALFIVDRSARRAALEGIFVGAENHPAAADWLSI